MPSFQFTPQPIQQIAFTTTTSPIFVQGPVQGPPGNDGADGADSVVPGPPGYTPVKGVDYFDGVDGYTPIKGVDYFDGTNGTNGTNGYTPIKGVDYFDGINGTNGTNGAGLPVGGSDNQILTKQSAADYDYAWETPVAGVTDHTLLSNIGTNTHSQIDTALTRLANTSGTNTGDNLIIGTTTPTPTTGAKVLWLDTTGGNITLNLVTGD